MKLSDMAKKMIISILIISSICVLGSVIYYRSLEFIPFLLGALLGDAGSIAKVFLLERAIDKALSMEQKYAGLYLSAQHITRLLLTAGVLLVGALVPQINLWGAVAGILSYQVAIYSVKFTSKKK